jgi:hypothetical protein
MRGCHSTRPRGDGCSRMVRDDDYLDGGGDAGVLADAPNQFQ